MHPSPKTAATAQFLPLDIIQEIFSHHSTTLFVLSRGTSKTGFPWFLGHICSSWRAAFLSMYAEFWSSLIMLPKTPLSTIDEKRSVDIVTTFMERAEGRPISLSLYLRYMSRPVIDIFIRHCKQWQHVELFFQQKQLPLLSPIKNQLPLLCSLRLGFGHPMPLSADPLEPIVLFENAPLLTHVRLHQPWRWRFYWPSLSTLELHRSIEVDILAEILSQLQNLETLHTMQCDSFDAITNIPKTITMARLKVLRIFGSLTLAFLTAPSLEVLHVETCRDWNSVSTAFLQRSACRLLGLSLGACTAEPLATIIPFIPTIQTLYVGCDVDCHNNPLTDFFHTLACPPGEPHQLPQLHTIRLSTLSTITEEDVTALRSMITLRSHGHHPKLRQVSLLPCQEEFYEVPDRVLRMLEKLRQDCKIQGVRIRIRPISYEDFETPFFDGNRHYFDVHFTSRLCR